MAIQFLSSLTKKRRTRQKNMQLGGLLAWVAGAVNAGGFLAVGRYTSHMTGLVSGAADDLVLGNVYLALAGLAFVGAFVAGAMTTSLQINWARRRRMQGEFAWSLMLEAMLLLVFGLLGANLNVLIEVFAPTTVLLLCYIMGLQNAIVTKISAAEIRTTHMTGVITDLGIELGRLFYWNHNRAATAEHYVQADRGKLRTHATLLGLFFSGALLGAVAFKTLGFLATVPIALLLMAVAVPSIYRDVQGYLGLSEAGAPPADAAAERPMPLVPRPAARTPSPRQHRPGHPADASGARPHRVRFSGRS